MLAGVAIAILIKAWFSWESVGFASILAAFIYGMLSFNKWIKKLSEWQIENRKKWNCLIKEDHFYFPKGYYYRYGCMKGKKALPYKNVTEIRTNTYPPTAIANNNEVIFLLGIDTTSLGLLKSRKPIRLTQPEDIWSMLCEDFLDTEYDEVYRKDTHTKLRKHGLGKEEIRQIRKRLSIRMTVRSLVTLEWQYYGQFDVMQELWPMTKKKYWWTMQIALKHQK